MGCGEHSPQRKNESTPRHMLVGFRQNDDRSESDVDGGARKCGLLRSSTQRGKFRRSGSSRQNLTARFTERFGARPVVGLSCRVAPELFLRP